MNHRWGRFYPFGGFRPRKGFHPGFGTFDNLTRLYKTSHIIVIKQLTYFVCKSIAARFSIIHTIQTTKFKILQ